MTRTIAPGHFTRFMRPILEILRQGGGVMRASEVVAKAMDALEISEDEQAELLPSVSPRAKNQAFWARLYLVKAGYLKSQKRGIWGLTHKGSQLLMPTISAGSLEGNLPAA